MKKIQLLFCFTVAAFLAGQSAMVQGQSGQTTPIDPAAAASVTFTHHTIDDGLSHNEVFSLLQSEQGFIWAGTRRGLNKYDGQEFVIYDHDLDNPNSLSSNSIWSLLEDSSGRLWISTWGDGLNLFEPESETYSQFRYDETDAGSLSNDFVWNVFEDSRGTIWVGTDDGLNRYVPESRSFVRYYHRLDDETSLSHSSVTSIQEDARGDLWLGTYGGGLNRLDTETGAVARIQHHQGRTGALTNNLLWSVLVDSSGTVWAGSEIGLNRLDPESGLLESYRGLDADPVGLGSSPVTSILEDRRGQIWFGTQGAGLFLLDPQTEKLSQFQFDTLSPDSLSSNAVWDILEDETGALWFATSAGIDQFDPGARRFQLFRGSPDNPNTLSIGSVTSFSESEPGIIWIGTNGGGLNKFNRQDNSFTHFKNDTDNDLSLSSNDISDLQSDGRGGLWVATLDGLNHFDEAGQQFVRHQHDPDEAHTIAGNTVYALDAGEDGRLWLAIFGTGLDLFDPASGEFTHFAPQNGDPTALATEWITDVEVANDGQVWAGGAGGLSRFDPAARRFHSFSVLEHGISGLIVTEIYEDSHGVIWIGTDSGLNKYDQATGTFLVFRLKDGLAGNLVSGVMEDDQGDLWVSTDRGVSRFDSARGTFRNCDIRDGLQSNQFEPRTTYKTESGELFLGGANGFNAFYPDKLPDNTNVPQVVFTNFQLFGQDAPIGGDSPLKTNISFADEVILSHKDSVFTLEFAALNFRHPDKNQYAYMLEGFDPDWTFVDSDQRRATYTNLDPGIYTFRVKASNNDSLWNETGSSLRIVVVPPWWETWWFYALSAASLLGLFGLAYRSKANQLEAERTMAASLRESEERFRQLAENVPEVFWLGAPDWSQFNYVSPAYEEVWGRSAQDLYRSAADWLDAIVETDRQKISSLLEHRAAEDTTPLIFPEYQILTAGGELRWISTRGFPIQDHDGGVIRMAGIAEDITDRKRIESQLKVSLEEKDVLLRELYHRTKNNMQVISAMLSLRASDSDDKATAAVLHEMENRIKTMALVHEKLYKSQDLSKINLNSYFSDLLNLLGGYYDAVDRRISMELDAADISVVIDVAIPCGLILNELVSNAFKHAFPKGESGIITVTLRRIGENELMFQVSDNGSGFASGPDALQSNTLGLPTVKAIAQHQLQGQVELETKAGVTCRIQFKDDLYEARV